MVLDSYFCLFLYLLVNSLFVAKYVGRVESRYVVPALFLYVLFILLVSFIIKKRQSLWSVSKRWLAVIVVLATFVLCAIQYHFDPYEIKVDRWSAIHNFLANLFAGQYPYAAQTHLGGYGSPFPVWQLFHIPFYLLGNVGLSFVAGLWVFLHAVYKLFGVRTSAVSFIFLILSPAFLYEVSVRSDLITNFLLASGMICYLHYSRCSFERYWLVIAVMCGLIMSTRLSALIPFMVYYFCDYLHAKWSVKLLFPLLVISTFCITFLPFLLWNGQMLLFFEYNPFVLQSRQGHLSDFLLFVPFGVWAAVSWHGDIVKYMRRTAWLLILLVIVTFVHNMYINNNWYELFAPAYDITYFNMSIPFLILSIFSFPDK